MAHFAISVAIILQTLIQPKLEIIAIFLVNILALHTNLVISREEKSISFAFIAHVQKLNFADIILLKFRIKVFSHIIFRAGINVIFRIKKFALKTFRGKDYSRREMTNLLYFRIMGMYQGSGKFESRRAKRGNAKD